MNKKAITLLEVILVLILLSAAAAYMIKQFSHTQYLKAVTDTQNQIRTIIRENIISTIGYASGTGKRKDISLRSDINGCLDSDFPANDNGCSPNLDFTCLSSARLKKCMDWSNEVFTIENKSQTNNTTGGGSTTINYSGLIPQENDKLMYSYGSCSLWVRQVPSARRAFDIFVDCSNVDYRDDSPKLLEDSIKFVFQEDYADISVNIKSD
ncbi:MAG: hypothetical protein GY932_01535, partial [Arcobacter sp.]|nr:hypothetical protein [Arcobacter sp.]